MLFDAGCVVCGALAGPVCGRCEAALRPAGPLQVRGVDVCRAAYSLDNYSKQIVAALKYKRQRRLARWIADRIDDLVPIAADVITWVPSTPQRRRTRGYDQAEQLARELAHRSGVPAQRMLERHADDQRQTGQSRSDRLVGPTLRAIDVGADFVVVVDDVITTGSSVRVAAATLRAAGATRLVAVTAAATPMNRDECLGAQKHGVVSMNGRET